MGHQTSMCTCMRLCKVANPIQLEEFVQTAGEALFLEWNDYVVVVGSHNDILYCADVVLDVQCSSDEVASLEQGQWFVRGHGSLFLAKTHSVCNKFYCIMHIDDIYKL